MKKTFEQCFSNGSECVSWIERNCDRCIKGQHYKEKTDTYSISKCSVYRDIITQYLDASYAVNLRSVDAVRQSSCPYIQTERKPVRKHRDKPDEPKLFKS